jgi:hypothetical protein
MNTNTATQSGSHTGEKTPAECPDCQSANMSQPDHEGFVDCFECGAAFIPSRV